MHYPLIFKEEGGDIVVRSRHFPELLTAGDTRDEALELAEDALVVALLTYVEKGIPLPDPVTDLEYRPDETDIYVPAQVTAKLAVIQAFRESGITKSELARRMDIGENEARRILDPNYGTKLDKLDAAMRALGERLEVRRVA